MATTIAFVRQLPGILEIEAELSDRSLTVAYDQAQVTKDEIIETIEDLGYTVIGEFVPPGEK